MDLGSISMNIIKHRNIYFIFSGLLCAISIVALGMYGLRLGIDFTGGALSEIEVHEEANITPQDIEGVLTQGEEPVLSSVRVQPTGEHGYVLRFEDVDQQKHQQILETINTALFETLPKETQTVLEEARDAQKPKLEALDADGNVVDVDVDLVPADGSESVIETPQVLTEERFESIGPVIGEELKQKSVYAMIAVLLGIIFYIAWAFRKVSEPVSSWKYGVTAVIALAHDVLIPAGVFAILGYVAQVEVDILFVTALLTILGFSVNDTIVVFDRTRENLSRDHHKHDFDWIVNKSVTETIRRSLFTSLTTFVVLLSVYLYGGASIKQFILALLIGVVVGTYSSIFLASPLLVVWEHFSRRRS